MLARGRFRSLPEGPPMLRLPPRRAWLPLAATLLLPAAAAHAAAPSADLYVSASSPSRNFGAARTLVVARHPASRAFMRFGLGRTPALRSKIALYVYPLTSSSRGVLLRHASDRP